MSALPIFLSGAVAMGFLTCALFFLRFWMGTRDRLFLSFAAAFLLLSVGQALLVLSGIRLRSPARSTSCGWPHFS